MGCYLCQEDHSGTDVEQNTAPHKVDSAHLDNRMVADNNANEYPLATFRPIKKHNTTGQPSAVVRGASTPKKIIMHHSTDQLHTTHDTDILSVKASNVQPNVQSTVQIVTPSFDDFDRLSDMYPVNEYLQDLEEMMADITDTELTTVPAPTMDEYLHGRQSIPPPPPPSESPPPEPPLDDQPMQPPSWWKWFGLS